VAVSAARDGAASKSSESPRRFQTPSQPSVPAVRSPIARRLVEFAVGAALGLGALVVPVLFGWVDRGSNRGILQAGVEELGVAASGLLFVAGLALGLFGTCKPWVHGASTMAALPLMIVRDGIVDPTSHNLLPFELAIYAAISVLAMAGAWAGRFLRGRVSRTAAS
jgi:hypothetical protein